MKKNNDLRKKATALRKRGKSYNEITDELGVSKSTLSYWLKNVPLAKKHRERLYTARIRNMALGPKSNQARREREITELIATAEQEIAQPLSHDAFLLLGAALYWAEGSKGAGVEITNADPSLILFMVRWFEKILGVPSKELRAWLNIYAQQDEHDLKRFWSDLTGIPIAQFGKSFIKPTSSGVKKNNLYYGTIKVRVPKSTDEKHRIFGWLQGALGENARDTSTMKEKWSRLQAVEKPVNLGYTARSYRP